MFGSRRKRKRLENACKLIAEAGKLTAQAYQHEKSLQWHSAQEWLMFCGTIPAFASLIAIEELIAPRDPRNKAFYKEIEDVLFSIFENSKSNMVSLRACVPLESERKIVRDAYNVPDDVNMKMDAILGVIFPGRSLLYQNDMVDGQADVVSGQASKNVGAPFCYIAMHLASHLTGIETPDSLVGHNAGEFGISTYGSAMLPISEFGTAYLSQRT